jgi:hypothetical protein
MMRTGVLGHPSAMINLLIAGHVCAVAVIRVVRQVANLVIVTAIPTTRIRLVAAGYLLDFFLRKFTDRFIVHGSTFIYPVLT